MQPSFDKEKLKGVTFLVGSEEQVADIQKVRPLKAFDENVTTFLDKVSKYLMRDPEAKAYPEIITLGFWIRKANIAELQKKIVWQDNVIAIGRGVAFHVAPSNVPVNYMYSLITGLLSGNANIVKVPSKDFDQVRIINNAISKALEEYPEMKAYIVLVRYGHEKDVNDCFSALCDTRVIWGGDDTIATFRESPIAARTTEIAFADRYSLAVIDSDAYLESNDKERLANDFFNDTYLTDQNACTSPRTVVWTGSKKEEAKEEFWKHMHSLLKQKYQLQPVQAVNKLTSLYILASEIEGVKKENSEDNLIFRVKVNSVDDELMNFRDNSGFFFEYDCDNLEDIIPLCNNTHCQTIGYLGDGSVFRPLIESGIKGVDRIVPMGKTMDFEFIWDGYDLIRTMTRSIRCF